MAIPLEDRTALAEMKGRVESLDASIAFERKQSLEHLEESRIHEDRITGLKKLRRDYIGLLAQLEA